MRPKNGPQRTLAVASHAVVALWIAAALGLAERDMPDPADLVEPLTRVRALAALPEPRPEPQAAVELLRSVGATQRAEGQRLLAETGAFPALSATYADFGSFADYAAAMERIGARFVVVRNRRIVGQVDLESRRVRESALQGDFSPRARDYSDEAGLAAATRLAREHFGADAVVMMLVPRALDAGLLGGIAHALAQRGEGPADFRELRGHYVRGPGGTVHFRVESARRGEGPDMELPLRFDLGSLATDASAAPGEPAA